MIKIQAFLGNNDVMEISEALKELEIGGLTVGKVRGRGKRPPPEIHASKGSAIFQPQFSQKYVVELVIPESKEDQVINIIKDKATTVNRNHTSLGLLMFILVYFKCSFL